MSNNVAPEASQEANNDPKASKLKNKNQEVDTSSKKSEKSNKDLQYSVIRPSGWLSSLVKSNISLLSHSLTYVFGAFPLFTEGLVSRRHFFLAGLIIQLIKMTVLSSTIYYLHKPPHTKPRRSHPWAYTTDEGEQLNSLFSDWMQLVGNWNGAVTNMMLIGAQLAVSLFISMLTLCAINGTMRRRSMHKISKLAKLVNLMSLLLSIFHVVQLVLPVSYISHLASHKIDEMLSSNLFNSTKANLIVYSNNEIRMTHRGSLHFQRASMLDKIQFNEQCCGVRSTDDWFEFAPRELAVFASFLSTRHGQLPPYFRTKPPASCYNTRTSMPHEKSCSLAIEDRYISSRAELLPLAVVALLSLLATFYLQRAFTAQDGLSGLEPEAINLAGDVAATSSLTGSSQVTDKQMNTTVPLVSVPTRIVRPVFEQCPKIGECTADVAHARLGYNEPLSFEERATVTCSPQFFPLCFSPDSGALIGLLQFCIRVAWGLVVYKIFVTHFARFYYKSSLGSIVYSRLLQVSTLVAFIFPVVISKRFLLVTILFIPSLFLDFGAGYIISKLVEAVFSGPFQTLMHNVNQTQLSMQCFIVSGSDLAEAGLKLSLKPFVNVAHEYMSSALLLSFLFKRLNSSAGDLHTEYEKFGDKNDTSVFDKLKITNFEMNRDIYEPLELEKPTNPDAMSSELAEASLQAEEELARSDREDEEEEAEAIRNLNARIKTGKAAVKFARDQYNKFTAALSKAKQKSAGAFKRKIKSLCKTLVFDIVNKCNKIGDRLCDKYQEHVPFYMRIPIKLMNIFDCTKIKNLWMETACERVKPTDFVKKMCLDYAQNAAPLPGFDGEFQKAFEVLMDLVDIVSVEFEFTTIIGRFIPKFSAEEILQLMAEVAFFLIDIARLGIFHQVFELANDMMIGTIIGEIFIFIKRFNTDLAFCNHYVTQQFIEIDYRRKQTIVNGITDRARDSLLPFAGWEIREPVWIGEEHESELITYPEQITLTHGERNTILRLYIADLSILAVVGVLFVANFLVEQAVDTMNAGLPANLTFVSTAQLNVTVHGVDVNLAKRLTFGLVRDLTHTAVINTTVELEDCKVTTKKMDEDEVNMVVQLIVLKLCMNLLYGYMSRLRPFLCALFYPEQQRRRTVALYNQLLRRREKRQRFFRDQVLQRILAEKFNREPFGVLTRLRLRSPTWNSIFGSLPFMNGNVECLCCGDRGFEQFKICLDCSGSYCRPCWYRLNSMCLLCILLFKRLALDYQEYREELQKLQRLENDEGEGEEASGREERRLPVSRMDEVK